MSATKDLLDGVKRHYAFVDGSVAQTSAAVAKLDDVAAGKEEKDEAITNYVKGKFDNITQLLQNNRKWAKTVSINHPGYFEKLSAQQKPKILWIGCSDSRVPANQIVGLDPGEIFVHRNIANVVLHSDINCLSVMQYAVEVLKVEHIIVTGHYGCGGVLTAMKQKLPLTTHGLLECWLRNMKDTYEDHAKTLERAQTEVERQNLFCEINVINSVQNVCKSAIVQNAWARGQTLTVHGWCYRLSDGTINDLSVDVDCADHVDKLYHVDLGLLPHGKPT